MLKTRKRWISLLVTVAMLAALIVPVISVSPAFASSTYSVSSTPTVPAGFNDDPNVTLMITMDTTVAQVAYGSVVLDLPTSPSGFAMKLGGITFNTNGAFSGSDVTVDPSVGTAASEFTLTINGHHGPKTSDNTVIYVDIANLKVPGGFSGDVKLTASAPQSSSFSSGSIVIATVGTGKVSLALESVETGSSEGIDVGVIDVKETQAGSLDDGPSSIKLTLPNGFSWDESSAVVKSVWGTFEKGAITFAPGEQLNVSGGVSLVKGSDERVLKLNMNGFVSTDEGAFLKISGLKIEVDESLAKVGDITAKVGGDSTITTSDFTIATYGEYGITYKALSSESLVAGQVDQDLGKLEIDEGIKNSIIDGRTLTLTLPDNVKWSFDDPAVDRDLSNLDGVDVTSGNYTAVGSDGKTLKITFTAEDETQASKIVFKDLKVTPGIDFTGDVKVELGGTQGITGEVVLGKVSAPVAVEATTAPGVQIGAASQAAADITITENAAGAISSTITAVVAGEKGRIHDVAYEDPSGYAALKLTLPSGVTFASTPTVEVTSGDLLIDKGSVKTDTDSNNAGFMTVKVKGSSTTASTIKVTGIKLTVDRTVPVGPITMKVKGSAVDQSHPWSDAVTIDSSASDPFPTSSTAAKVDIAKCTTSISGEATGTAVFKIGEASYTLNGISVAMDVAPYINKDGRTFMPVRYAANALGVSDANIVWDDVAKKATIIKGDRLIQFTVGSTVLVVNGATITMDAAPEIVSGRVMVPIRFLGQALGASFEWDETAQTVTANY